MKVWLAISSFQNDDQVLTTVEKARAFVPELFDCILIVDSEGTGRVPEAIRDRGWTDVEYRNYPENLGSGANLAERLKIAASAGADYIYALNHDGEIHPIVVRKLIEAASGRPRLGAAYPLGYFTETRSYNLTGTRELPLPAKLVKAAPAEPIIPVYWSSSNGALYSLEPARKNILPWPAMWMGWEDLDYGWRLKDNEYEQILVTNAVFPDNQEYTATTIGTIVRKPAWRAYYNIRNLVFAVRRSRNRPMYHAVVAFRLIGECILTLLFREQKFKRFRLLLAGARDGYTAAWARRPFDSDE
jgi:GT2 family glycosyltransferase